MRLLKNQEPADPIKRRGERKIDVVGGALTKKLRGDSKGEPQKNKGKHQNKQFRSIMAGKGKKNKKTP